MRPTHGFPAIALSLVLLVVPTVLSDAAAAPNGTRPRFVTPDKSSPPDPNEAAFIRTITSNAWFSNRPTLAGCPRPDWMAQLSDTLALSELSLPGTHDTMTSYYAWWMVPIQADFVMCQNIKLTAQLNAGIRAIDIRCKNEATTPYFGVYHTEYLCSFVETIREAVQFLKAHSTEVILMRIVHTEDGGSPATTFADQLEWQLDQIVSGTSGDKFGDYVWLSANHTEPPVLGDVRGKIVILQQFASAYRVGEGPAALTASDFTGDGSPDVAVANLASGTVTLSFNDGGGRFVVGQTVPIADGVLLSGGLDNHISPVAEDLNGDFLPDLAVTHYGEQRLSIALNTGSSTGPLAPPTHLPLPYRPWDVAPALLDADPLFDLIVSAPDVGAVTVLLNDSTAAGTFSEGGTYVVGNAPSSIVTADFNLDGWADVAVADPVAGTVSLLLNLGDGTGALQGSETVGQVAGLTWMRSIDVNGDTLPDLVGADLAAGAVTVLANEPALPGTFASPVPYDIGSSVGALAAADVDRDQHPDLVVATSSSRRVYVLLNAGDGSGTFQSLVVTDPRHCTCCPDLSPDAGFKVYSGRGGGSATANPTAMLCTDLDADGDNDLVTATTADAILVSKNDGDGYLSSRANYGFAWPDEYEPTQIALTDDYQLYWSGSSFAHKRQCTSDHIAEAQTGDPARFYCTYISGVQGYSGPVFPYYWFPCWPPWIYGLWPTVVPEFIYPSDVAKGRSINRLLPCIANFSWRGQTGLNQHTYKLLKPELDGDMRPIDPKRAGVVWMDYPGDGLIDRIVMCNGLPPCGTNLPPDAVAGGPYIADEGTEIVFDGSGSSDADGDPLRYRWVLEKPEIQPDSTGGTTILAETDWSDDPTAAHTFYDDELCFVRLQVTDDVAGHIGEAVDSVRIMNVSPLAAIDSLSSPVAGCILPGQEVVFHGSFVDPGCDDVHSCSWDFDDGVAVTDTFAVESEAPDATGWGSEPYVFPAPDLYSIILAVEDDDGGVGADTSAVKVMTAVEAIDFIDAYVQELPAPCFAGPAVQRKAALTHKFDAVQELLTAGLLLEAMDKLLHDLRSKMDGDLELEGQNDWITDGSAQQDLCLMIDELVVYLEALHLAAQPTAPQRLFGADVARADTNGPSSELESQGTFALAQNSPNPFYDATSIQFQLPTAGHVLIRVYDVTGKAIRTLAERSFPPGTHTVRWDGRDERSHKVASGVYFCRIQTGDFTDVKRMTMTR